MGVLWKRKVPAQKPVSDGQEGLAGPIGAALTAVPDPQWPLNRWLWREAWVELVGKGAIHFGAAN